MTASNRGFRGRSTNLTTRSSAMPDNFGNRRTFDDVRVPPDNIGNNAEQDLMDNFVHDGLGNSTDDEPAHLKSGILAKLSYERNDLRRRRPERNFVESIDPHHRHASSKMPAAQAPVEPIVADEYVAQLNAEFAKLFRQKSGLAFSFSMKALGDKNEASEEILKEELFGVKDLIMHILEANGIKAVVGLMQYRTPVHLFAVFFIGPEIEEPVRNKELIAALRQVVNEYTLKMVKSCVNVFLVLANARKVIEEHLLKIGAKKVEDTP